MHIAGSIIIYHMTQNRLRCRSIKIVMLSIFCTVLCFAQQESNAQRAHLQAKLSRYLDHAADSTFAFSALVAVDGTIIHQKGYGWIDSSRTRQATPRTLYNIASITKSFTAIAVVSLIDQHVLSADDTLPKFFNNVPKDKQSITLAELLTHTSGLAQHYAADGISDRDSAVRSILHDSLAFISGTNFSYSNENYELLGAIIEVVTHRSYEAEIRKMILKKAKMTDTRFWGDTAGISRIEIAPMIRKLDPEVLRRNWGYLASGGMYSNVVDLYRWFSALVGGRIQNPESLHQMWSVRRQLTETGVTWGWYVSSSPAGGREIWTRGTEDWGHNGVIRWFPDRKVLVIVLTNSGERGDKNVTANRTISDGMVKIIFE
jgi:CubicO group peptidase (beta-lactamase class C family)